MQLLNIVHSLFRNFVLTMQFGFLEVVVGLMTSSSSFNFIKPATCTLCNPLVHISPASSAYTRAWDTLLQRRLKRRFCRNLDNKLLGFSTCTNGLAPVQTLIGSLCKAIANMQLPVKLITMGCARKLRSRGF